MHFIPKKTGVRGAAARIARRASLALVALGLGAVAATGPARAQSRSDATVYDRDDEARAAEVVPVRAAFVRPLDAHCELRAELSGRVRVAPEGTRFTPTLRVESAVECEGRTAERVVRTLRADAPLTREEMSLALDARARVRTAATGHACEYAPSFDFDGARFTQMTVTESCEYTPSQPAVR